MDDIDEQENELIALSSIFDSETFNIISGDDPHVIVCKTVKFVIDIQLPEAVEIYYTSHDGKENRETTKKTIISYLPPVYATISLPTDYPTVSTPNVVLSAAWLHPILSDKILRKLSNLSAENPGVPILYLYYQLIKDETFVLIDSAINLNLCLQTSPNLLLRCCHTKHKRKSFSKSNSVDEDSNTKISSNHVRQLFDSLIDYNDYRLEQLFRNEKHLCEICYTEFYGSECLQFTPCKHVFCKLCCKQFFEMHIKEGTFELLKCLAEKCNTIAIPMFIKSVVDDSAFERYDKLTLSSSLY
uniref:RING-type domain-containing protein n=1 Tax=Romanomermis culicivorax TaxID=13658 RepID=A0A915IRB1_ROMCU